MGCVTCGIWVGSNPRFTDLMRYGKRSVIKKLMRICERKEWDYRLLAGRERMIFSRGGSGWWTPRGDESKIFWHKEMSYVRDVLLQLTDRGGKSRFKSVARPNLLKY